MIMKLECSFFVRSYELQPLHPGVPGSGHPPRLSLPVLLLGRLQELPLPLVPPPRQSNHLPLSSSPLLLPSSPLPRLYVRLPPPYPHLQVPASVPLPSPLPSTPPPPLQEQTRLKSQVDLDCRHFSCLSIMIVSFEILVLIRCKCFSNRKVQETEETVASHERQHHILLLFIITH